jgi:hypothetical protein
MDTKHACPLCNHYKVRKRYLKGELEASLSQAEEDKATRKVAWNNMAEDVRGEAPRRKRILQQEYWCVCYQIGGSTKDRCLCSLGPFTDAQRELIPGWHEEYLLDNGDENRITVAHTVGTFLNDLATSSIEVCILLVYTYAVADVYELIQSFSGLERWDTAMHVR